MIDKEAKAQIFIALLFLGGITMLASVHVSMGDALCMQEFHIKDAGNTTYTNKLGAIILAQCEQHRLLASYQMLATLSAVFTGAMLCLLVGRCFKAY